MIIYVNDVGIEALPTLTITLLLLLLLVEKSSTQSTYEKHSKGLCTTITSNANLVTEC